ncbi:hypothetical protein Ciccas_014047 [Cichlidogyrus casuarinus]|uniref:Uncharacterized protein n=1 Tax=Cichlidogyrus casuarinus TaxID=1844966 RepID=A0ABD2PLA4_9PLAT
MPLNKIGCRQSNLSRTIPETGEMRQDAVSDMTELSQFSDEMVLQARSRTDVSMTSSVTKTMRSKPDLINAPKKVNPMQAMTPKERYAYFCEKNSEIPWRKVYKAFEKAETNGIFDITHLYISTKPFKLVAKTLQDISCNKIGTDGCKALEKFLRKNGPLRELILCENDIGNEDLAYIIKGLDVSDFTFTFA